MRIRKATIDDRFTIGQFQIAMALETENLKLNPEVIEKGVIAVFRDPTRGIYFVAEKEAKVVGSLLITFEWSDWRNGNVWWIQLVYIKPEARRNGIFKKMYMHVKEIVLIDPHLQGLRLYADKSNKIAHNTYHNLGMDSNHYDMFEWMK